MRDATNTIEETRDAAEVTTEVEVQDELVLEELLVEDISIDGMCGVY